MVTLHNLSQAGARPIKARYCVSFFCRLRGLTFRKSLAADEALLLVQSSDSRLDSAIHMMAVWIDLAVVWINAAGEVVDVKLARRWRPLYVAQRPAKYVLEMAASRLDEFKIGDRVRIERS